MSDLEAETVITCGTEDDACVCNKSAGHGGGEHQCDCGWTWTEFVLWWRVVGEDEWHEVPNGRIDAGVLPSDREIEWRAFPATARME